MINKQSRILVIDDMLSMRMLVTKSLRDLGFLNLVEASDGSQGWEILSTAAPPIDLVISDWSMPVLTGYELLAKIRNSPTLAQLPVILLTAEAEVSMVKAAVSIGVTGYLVKPFTLAALKNHLGRIGAKTGMQS